MKFYELSVIVPSKAGIRHICRKQKTIMNPETLQQLKDEDSTETP